MKPWHISHCTKTTSKAESISFDGSHCYFLLTCISFTCIPEGTSGSPSLCQPKPHLGLRELTCPKSLLAHKTGCLSNPDVPGGGSLIHFHTSINPALSTSKHRGHLAQSQAPEQVLTNKDKDGTSLTMNSDETNNPPVLKLMQTDEGN